MSRWFRHYAGMMRDEKLVRAAVASKQPVERVVWVWGAVLESAAEINDGGRYELDAGEASYFLRCDAPDVVGILASLESLGRLIDGCVARWGDRQFDSDASRERQRKYRERQANSDVSKVDSDAGIQGCDVTRPSRDGEVTPQETETETDYSKPNGLDSLSREFDEAFWPLWPEKVQRKPALAAFRKARKREDLETILDGVRRYVRTKPPDRPWLNPTTFLNQERWNDEPSGPAAPAPRRNSRPHDAIFRALAEQAQAGNGLDQRQAGPDGRDGADSGGAGADPSPVIDLEAAAFRRAV